MKPVNQRGMMGNKQKTKNLPNDRTLIRYPHNNQNVIIMDELYSHPRRKSMTVCIGVICNNGQNVVLSGDRMITGNSLSIEFEHPKPKLKSITDNCAIATAGDALAYTELINRVVSEVHNLKNPSITQIVKEIQDAYVDIRQKRIQDLILRPRGIPDIYDFYKMQQSLIPDVALAIQNAIDSYDYGLEILIGGVDGTGAHLYGVANPGVSVCFDALGYNAIGIGEPHAVSTIISSEHTIEKSVEETLYLVFKAKRVSEKAPGVGDKYTDLWVVNHEATLPLQYEVIKTLNDYYKIEQEKTKLTLPELQKISEDMKKEKSDKK
jgi:20S proteasome alpha/beta subunit